MAFTFRHGKLKVALQMGLQNTQVDRIGIPSGRLT